MKTGCHTTTIYSIGYGNRTIETFISLLNQHMIRRVVDVRTNPFSRFNPNFRRQKLKEHLDKSGIKYDFMGEALGGKPLEGIMLVDGKLDYDLITTSPLFLRGIDGLKKMLQDHVTTVIMCCELNADNCHRKSLISRYLETQSIIVNHIDRYGQIDTLF